MPDLLRSCEICGGRANLDRHHVAARRMGGSKNPSVLSDENLLTLCRSCHRNVHEGGWHIQRSPDSLRVVDGRTGAEVMRRHFSEEFAPATLLHTLEGFHSFLDQALEVIRYLDDEQLVEAFRSARSLGKRAWLLQAAILHEAQQRSVYGDRSMEAIARKFEISLRQAQKYALVWRLFFAGSRNGDSGDEAKSVNVDVFFLQEPSWYVVAATESPDPQRWLGYAQDRKAENPRFSIGEFRRDIQQAVGSATQEIEETPTAIAQPDRRSVWDCPWVKPYCTRSGRPVPADDCPCEEAAPAT